MLTLCCCYWKLGGATRTRPRTVGPLHFSSHVTKDTDKGCDTEKAKDCGATPLYIACDKGHVDIVLLLLEAGRCDKDKAEDRGPTPG